MKVDDGVYFSYDAVKRTPAGILKHIIETAEYQKELIEENYFKKTESYLKKNKFIYCGDVVYGYEEKNKHTGIGYYIEIKNENKPEEGRFREIYVSVDYYFNSKKYSIFLSLGSGIRYLDKIYLIYYVYKNNKSLIKAVEDLLVDCGYDSYRGYYADLHFDIKKDKKRVYSFLREATKWIFTQEEIVEVLKGNKWLEGYCPPSPF